ncbi:MAG: preprotein translocase subunit TatA [Halanaeroarchaeum sp.]
MTSSLLFVGVPGGMELAVILLIFVLLFGVPLTLLLVLGYRFTARKADERETEERIDELESEVETLRNRLEDDR